ncbi:MAG: hypothetical protein ACRELB_10110 [Polyangiaceae bacterium]
MTKLTANVADADLDKIDALVARHAPFAHRHAVHLAALRVGLEALEAEPGLLAVFVAEARRRGVAA